MILHYWKQCINCAQKRNRHWKPAHSSSHGISSYTGLTGKPVEHKTARRVLSSQSNSCRSCDPLYPPIRISTDLLPRPLPFQNFERWIASSPRLNNTCLSICHRMNVFQRKQLQGSLPTTC